MIPLHLARLPHRYATLDADTLEETLRIDYIEGVVTIEAISLWAHQAVMRDLVIRLPDHDPQAEIFPEETRLEHLKWMLNTAWDTDMATDKAARWLAYVQGVCATRGWINVNEERDRTRHIFHLVARIQNKPTPQTLGPGK